MDLIHVGQIERALQSLERERDGFDAHALGQEQHLQSQLDAQEAREQAARDELALQQQRVISFQERLPQAEGLAARGAISRIDLRRIREELLAEQLRLAQLRGQLESAIAQTRQQRSLVSDWPFERARRQAELERRVLELNERLASARLRLATQVIAPRDGRVAAVLAREGQAVQAEHPLVLLADDAAALQAELELPSSAVGLVRPGQRVLLRLDAFPFQRFGMLGGKLLDVTAASVASCSSAPGPQVFSRGSSWTVRKCAVLAPRIRCVPACAWTPRYRWSNCA